MNRMFLSPLKHPQVIRDFRVSFLCWMEFIQMIDFPLLSDTKGKTNNIFLHMLEFQHHHPHHHPVSPILWLPGLATILEWLTDPTDSRFFSLSVSPSVMSMHSVQVQACSFSTSLYTRLQMLRRHSCQEFDFSDMTLFLQCQHV